MSTFAQAFTPAAQGQPYASDEDIARYCRDARKAGIERASRLVLEGHPGLAYLAIVEATEYEFSALGLGHVVIPATDGFRRIAEANRVRESRQLLRLEVA